MNQRVGIVLCCLLAVGGVIGTWRACARAAPEPGRPAGPASFVRPSGVGSEAPPGEAGGGQARAADDPDPVESTDVPGGAFAEALGPGLAEEWIEFSRLSGNLLWPEVPMRMEAAIWRAYRMVATNAEADVAALGYKMLSATGAFVRATGAIWMLEKNKTLHPAILDQLIVDEEAFVPLTVLGWMLDSGLEQEAGGFEARWRSASGEAQEAAIAALTEEPLNGMAGRAALWLAERSERTADEKRELDAQVLADDMADYGVRWQAALLLRGRMDFDEYQELIAGLEGTEGDAGFAAAMGLLNERVAGPPEVMGATPVLTRDDADLFFAEESALMLENVALWVEAATVYGAADVRPGFADALARHLAELPEEELPANQALTLRRIRSRLDALRQLERP